LVVGDDFGNFVEDSEIEARTVLGTELVLGEVVEEVISCMSMCGLC